MSTRSTPNVRNAKTSSQSSTAKFSTPTNSTPVKPVRSTLSLSKTVSSLPRAGIAKQKSACDLRERYNLNGNDSLNTAFTSTTPLSRTAKNGLTASSSNLSGTKSKSLFDDVKRFQSPATKSLFGSASLKLQENGNRTPECFSKVSFDSNTPQSNKKNVGRQSSSHTDQANSVEAKSKENSEVSNLMVAVRVRPMTAKECTTSTNVIFVDGNEVTALAGTNADSSSGLSYSFRYDSVFTSYDSDDTNYANQQKVFDGTALPLIDKAFEGYNACLFAYGQTGSGKSYSMMGTDSVDDTKPSSEAGIIPRFCHKLFHRIGEMQDKYTAQVEVSYFEIYNEKIHDLLVVTPTHIPNIASANQTSRPALRIREHAVWGPYVEDLNTHAVDSNRALKDWLDIGNSHRATAATGMNDKSSRSHSIFSITLTLSEIDGELLTKRSRISLVDLAGSERVSQTCAVGERLKEGININQSLLALGKVIAALADTKKAGGTFVPYRDSVLTRLLKENLGGNSKTIMLATISPASLHMDETLSTLRYACQARSIVNRVKVNQDRNDHEINSLRTEVDCLRAQVQYYKRQEVQVVKAPPRKIIIETIEAKSDDTEEMRKLRQQLHEKEQELTRAQKSWQDRIKEAEKNRRNEMRLLQQNGLALQLSVAQKQPCLINLANDPMLSGTLLYILPPGVVRIGRPKPSTHAQSDIILNGPLVGLNHCEIDNKRGTLFIRPSSDESETYVNGELISDERQIYHGDRIVIGGSHYFRLSDPECTQRTKIDVVDFQTAHQEILKEQEKRLRLELEVEKEAEFRKMEMERAKHELSYNEKLAKLELEKFRNQCNKELIDAEKEAMARNQTNESFFEYQPFESNLSEKIRRIMEHPSEEGLHEIQLKVKEATQRCRNLGLNYEFIQTQVVDEFGLFKAVVKIIDRKKCRSADWPTARLSVWLDLLRDSTDINADNIFQSIDIDWSEMSHDTGLNDSLNSSRISLNLSAIKGALFNSTTRNFFTTDQQKFENPINQCKNVTSQGFDDPPSSLIEKSNNLTEGISTSTPTAKSFIVDVQQRLRNVRKELTEIKNVCKNATDQKRNIQEQKIANEALNVLREIEPLTSKIRTLLKSSDSETTPAKSTKTVRFILD